MRVAQSEVNSLPGERVQDVRRVADQREPALHEVIHQHATQGEGGRWREQLQGTQGFVARFAHASAKHRGRESEQFASLPFSRGPDDRDAPARQRQKGEHAVAAKPLISDIAMCPRAGEVGDDAELRVARVQGLDARGAARPRLGSIGADRQFRSDHGAVLEADFDAIPGKTQPCGRRRAQQRQIWLTFQTLPQRMVKPARFDGRRELQRPRLVSGKIQA